MPLRYMLDSDICSYIMKRSHPAVLRRLQRLAVDAVCISVITKAELLYGLEVSRHRERDEAAVQLFLRHVGVMDLGDGATVSYAEIRAALKNKGTTIVGNDLLIAAHARSLGLTLVTNNSREFGRVPGLAIEDWTDRRAGGALHGVGARPA